MRIAALAATLLLASACSSARTAPGAGGESGDAARATPGPVVLDLPGLEGVDPASAGELRAVENLITEGSFVAARSLLDRVLVRPLDPRTLEVARRLERVLDLDPSYLPSLALLEHAVLAGDDREARAILDRIAARRPRGRLKDLVDSYRRILDGRDLVGGVRLALEFRPESLPPGEAGQAIASRAPAGARFARLYLVARTERSRAIELDPGPATLVVTRAVVASNGLQEDAIETRAVTSIRGLAIDRGHPAEVPLGYFFAVPPETGLATRLRFEIELRSGEVRLAKPASGESRSLPAMRLRVEPAEERALETSLAGIGPSAPEDLAALVHAAPALDALAALKIALRIPPEARARTLDLLAPLVEGVPLDVVRSLVPSLRWIALTGEPGSDASAWRAWLREREQRKRVGRPRLVLPDYRPEAIEP